MSFCVLSLFVLVQCTSFVWSAWGHVSWAEDGEEAWGSLAASVPGDGVVSTVHANGVNARFVLPLSGVLCLGPIDHSLQRLEGRVTTAVRLDARCIHPQQQERHNVIRSICRSSFAGLGLIRLVLWRSEWCTIFSHIGFYKGWKPRVGTQDFTHLKDLESQI